MKEASLKEVKGRGSLRRFEDPSIMRKIVAKTNTNVGQKVEYLLNTGNLVSQSGLDLQQVHSACLHVHRTLRIQSVSQGGSFAGVRVHCGG